MTLKIVQIYTYLHLLIKRYMENEPGSQGLFLPYVNPYIPWHKISVFEKNLWCDKQGVYV